MIYEVLRPRGTEGEVVVHLDPNGRMVDDLLHRRCTYLTSVIVLGGCGDIPGERGHGGVAVREHSQVLSARAVPRKGGCY